MTLVESWALFAGMMHFNALCIYGFAALMVSL